VSAELADFAKSADLITAKSGTAAKIRSRREIALL